MSEVIKKRGGRRIGAGKKRVLPFDEETRTLAMDKLTAAVKAGEQWAVLHVSSRLHPAPRPVTVEGTLDYAKLRAEVELTYAKIQELTVVAEEVAEIKQMLLAQQDINQ